jgi:hypothetical protein
MAHPQAALHGGGMTSLWTAALGSLAPWLALQVTIVLAEGTLHEESLVGRAVLSLFFVAAPSMMAIAAGRSSETRLAVTVVMTAVAVFAGLQVATIDDGQAGLAVFYVPMVAFPLAGVVAGCEAALDRYRATSTGGD